MARFIEVPTFDIYDEETGQWAKPEEWWLDGRMVYQSDLLDANGDPLLVIVPDRFCTDLSSLPRFPPFIRSMLLKNGKHRPAAVPHDYLCRLKKAFPRPLADAIFLEAMKLVGVKRWHRIAMWLAVRTMTEAFIWTGKAVRTWEDVK